MSHLDNSSTFPLRSERPEGPQAPGAWTNQDYNGPEGCDDPSCFGGTIRHYEAPEPEVGWLGGLDEYPCPFCEQLREDAAVQQLDGAA